EASGDFQLNNTAAPLTIATLSQGGVGHTAAIFNSGAVTITGTLSSPTGLAVTSSGAITETGAGLVTTPGLFLTSSAGGQTLSGANTVGDFRPANTTSGAITFANTAANLA